MNGQPPPPLPSSPAPAPVPPPQVLLPPEGIGCFAKGCLTVLVVGFILIVGVVGSVWFVFNKAVSNLTSAGSASVQLEQPTEAQFQAAEKALAQLNQAVASREETTVEFTGADLNALLARDETFKEFRGRARVDITDSIMTIDLSLPLRTIRWRKLQRRWFNGTARFGVSYSSGQFQIDLESAEAGGYRLPGRFISSVFRSALNEGLNEGFREKLRDYETGETFWEQVKSISLAGDKLIVTTQGK